MIQEAVCGFYIDVARTKVALIRKKRPGWQAGKLNGIGGKIEPHEDSLAAMVREFQEETGVQTVAEDWELFFVLRDEQHQYKVYYFRAHGDLTKLRSTTDEQVEIIPLGATPSANVVRNLTWLVPMAVDETFKDGEGLWE